MIFKYRECLSVGNIDSRAILDFVSEESIFELVFESVPKNGDKVTSPLRADTNPGCFFNYNSQGKLIFYDYGTEIYSNDKLHIAMDCFSFIQAYYKFPNYHSTLAYIYKELILGKNIPKLNRVAIPFVTVHKTTVIKIKPRNFCKSDKDFWSKYGITRANLIDDSVYPVDCYQIENTNGKHSITPHDICYAYTDFNFNRKKIYRPYKKGKYKFTTNCSSDDIGNLKSLPLSGNELYITKSYKDCRVLRNIGLSSVWFQSETMYPNQELLTSLCNRFSKVYILFDNDTVGIESGKHLTRVINSTMTNKASHIHLPVVLLQQGIKDPSDFISVKGKKELIKFIKENK